MATTSALISAFLSLQVGVGSEPPAQGKAKATGPGPVIALFAGGVYGAAIWTVDIDASGMASVSVVGGREPRKPMRLLTSSEQARLRSMVDALPTDRPRYHFGNGPIDGTMWFGLDVGTGKQARRYSIAEVLDEKDAALPEVKHILELLHFLHGLVGSSSALPPPQLKGQGSPK